MAVPFHPELAPLDVREDVLMQLSKARLGPELSRDDPQAEWSMGTSQDALRHLIDHWVHVRTGGGRETDMQIER